MIVDVAVIEIELKEGGAARRTQLTRSSAGSPDAAPFN